VGHGDFFAILPSVSVPDIRRPTMMAPDQRTIPEKNIS
jgi:hypothetical protein